MLQVRNLPTPRRAGVMPAMAVLPAGKALHGQSFRIEIGVGRLGARRRPW
ncbi:hypothetical protein C8P66_11021 [Humitalea rosea]|uniref:Uncharacterized protein n=1 Tax=Humitalea rosea TaxID=990373 RepID=A0A2W7IGQ0_9PROT|nr:hypothetical protein [Humitalea rosea]PZW45824.1 hypothetical protein C8P66_11021 [Humitalea rosea]